MPHIVTTRLSDLYHSPTATAADRATAAALWQANQGLFDELLLVGMLLTATGVVAHGSAMLGNPAFHGWLGRAGVALGVIGLGAGVTMLIDPYSPAAALGLFALIAFHSMSGYSLIRLSRTAVPAPLPTGRT